MLWILIAHKTKWDFDNRSHAKTNVSDILNLTENSYSFQKLVFNLFPLEMFGYIHLEKGGSTFWMDLWEIESKLWVGLPTIWNRWLRGFLQSRKGFSLRSGKPKISGFFHTQVMAWNPRHLSPPGQNSGILHSRKRCAGENWPLALQEKVDIGTAQ